MNTKFDSANELAMNSNNGILSQLDKQAEEKPQDFAVANEKAKQQDAEQKIAILEEKLKGLS